MTICIISTGDELLRGDIADTNGAWMAARLHERGHAVSEMRVVGDDLQDLTAAFEEAFNTHALVVVGGGLGPTDDDLTACAAARALRTDLERAPAAEAVVRGAFERLGRQMNEINLKQADLPRGCRVILNDNGTAPGFAVTTPAGRAVFLPGVPRELRAMFPAAVLDELPGPAEPAHRAVLKCFGRGESDLQAAIKPRTDGWGPELKLGFRASFPEIAISVTAADPNRARAALEELRPLLGRAVFADEEI
ncbi:MAG: competence/damage-inducible protein A, partial [Deltaproteobacteria bacterium]|nr:competence/damage-inducible protein A [Deltaproteobacteria bacterium]